MMISNIFLKGIVGKDLQIHEYKGVKEALFTLIMENGYMSKIKFEKPVNSSIESWVSQVKVIEKFVKAGCEIAVEGSFTKLEEHKPKKGLVGRYSIKIEQLHFFNS
jgi:single-stranded DNA-binding protein